MSTIGSTNLNPHKLNKIALCLIGSLMTAPLMAQELVQDGDFESQVLTDGAVTQTSSYWSFSANSQSGLFNPTTTQYVDEAIYSNVTYVAKGAKTTQDLGVALEMNKTYTLSVDVGWRNDNTFNSYTAGIRVDGTFIAFPVTVAPTQGQFVSVTAQFTTDSSHQALVDSGANMILELANPATVNSQNHFDNVSVVVGNSATTDADGDGMNDSWELANGLNPNDPSDASGDPDGDGASNLAEHNAGTDPNDGSSYPDMFPDGHDGNTKIGGGLQLMPLPAPPVNCEATHAGTMYYDSGLNSVLICDGNSWQVYAGEQGPKGDDGAPGADGTDGQDGLPGSSGTSHWVDGVGVVSTGVNVGIGTSTPNAPLEVNGNAIAHDPIQNNHLVTKGYSDTQDNNLQSQIDLLVARINDLELQVGLINDEVFPAPPPPVWDPANITVFPSTEYGGQPGTAVLDGILGNNSANVWIGLPDDPAAAIKFQLDVARTFTSYGMSRGYCTAMAYVAGTWVLSGSNDNVNFTQVDEVTVDQGNLMNCTSMNTYTVDNPGSYLFYKFEFVLSQYNTYTHTGVAIGEIDFVE